MESLVDTWIPAGQGKVHAHFTASGLQQKVVASMLSESQIMFWNPKRLLGTDNIDLSRFTLELKGTDV